MQNYIAIAFVNAQNSKLFFFFENNYGALNVVKQRNRLDAVQFMINRFNTRNVRNFSAVIIEAINAATDNCFKFSVGKILDVVGGITISLQIQERANMREKFFITAAIKLAHVAIGHPFVIFYSCNDLQDNAFKRYVIEHDRQIRDFIEVQQALADLQAE